MPLLYPDILTHSNPNNALVDSNFIKGATRSAVSNLTELYQLSAKGEAGSLGQLKDFATKVWVRSEGKYYTLINEASARNSFGWATDNQLLSAVISSNAFDTTAKYVSASDGALSVNYLTKATNSNGINESIISDNGSLVYVGGNLTISGNLTALGNSYFANTLFTTTCAISVVNNGPGPAMYVYQGPGTSDVASFYDGDGVEVLHVGNCDPGQQFGKVGINTGDPNKELTVKGSVSASGTLNIGTINANTASDSIVVLGIDNILERRSIDSRAWGSSLVDGSGTTNYVTKWSDSNTVTNSIVFDNGTNVGINETSPEGRLHVTAGSAGSVTAQPSSVGVFESSGNAYLSLLSPTSRFAGVVMGGPTNSYGSYVSWNHDNLALKVATNHAGASIQMLAGTEQEAMRITSSGNVGIGTISPSEKLDISGNLKTSGTATIGTIATGTADSVLIESSGLIQKRTIDSRAWGSSLVDGSGTANRVAYWTDSNTIAADDDFFFNGTNVGIGTTSPGVKLDVVGVIRSNSNTVTPAATTALPASNDVILNNQTGPVTITAFSNGVAGVTYTITNKSTHAVTLDTSASLFVRGGNSWASHKCTTNLEGYIVLPQNFSCSLRMDSATIGSAW